jgi:hypothetical protein
MLKRHYSNGIIIVLIVIACSFNYTYSQQKYNANQIRVSPKAGVMQVVGLTKINISYSRPGVKGRVIWGKLVPYNVVWRAGADEATKFTFSTDVKINGKKLKAGSYSFFIIPSKNGEWTLIFNKVADQWGAFEYNIAEDVFRFKVKPEKGNFVEWLEYTFTRTSNTSAIIKLEWDKLKIPFTVKVEAPKQK